MNTAVAPIQRHDWKFNQVADFVDCKQKRIGRCDVLTPPAARESGPDRTQKSSDGSMAQNRNASQRGSGTVFDTCGDPSRRVEPPQRYPILPRSSAFRYNLCMWCSTRHAPKSLMLQRWRSGTLPRFVAATRRGRFQVYGSKSVRSLFFSVWRNEARQEKPLIHDLLRKGLQRAAVGGRIGSPPRLPDDRPAQARLAASSEKSATIRSGW